MPIVGRSDGQLVENVSFVRRMMPYLMRGRNESLVYCEQQLDVSRTLPFIEAWNKTHERRITVFHVAIAALARVLGERSGLNRFISGGRIYQRNEIDLSFAVKKEFVDNAPLLTVKFRARPGESILDMVDRIYAEVGECRSGDIRMIDREVKGLVALPGPLLGLVMVLARLLDRWNLLPQFLMRDDPMFSSIFIANLGSLGIDRVWHHLYEYGNCGLFCAMGQVSKQMFVGDDDQVVVRPGLRLIYAFDERINDGHYCVRALQLARDYIENPERLIPQAPVQ